MKPGSILTVLLAASLPAAPAAAAAKCISMQPAASTSDSAAPAVNFSRALRETRTCADSQAYQLAETLDTPEAIVSSVVARYRHHVEDQAKYAVLANLGWTYQGLNMAEMKTLAEKAAAAVQRIKAGSCPVTMLPAQQAANGAQPRPRS